MQNCVASVTNKNKIHFLKGKKKVVYQPAKNRFTLSIISIHPLLFFLSFQNLEFEYIKEDVGYGTIDLLCDVGGTLSLLMGASLLTCCELLEVAWIVMAKKCCRKVGKTLAAPSRRAKRPFQSQDRGSSAGLGGLEGAGDSTSAVASNTTKLQTKV